MTGLPAPLLAEKIGVHKSTFNRWLQAAENQPADSLHGQLRAAIFNADAEYCRSLMQGLKQQADAGSSWAATWLLTHHPRLRDHFSDAAAERRIERRTVADMITAIAAAGLSPDDENRVLLHIQARGYGQVAPIEPAAPEGDADGQD